MNLSQLRYFRKLAEVQHFTKAAEELFITQPALSNSIKQLEGELGIPLFEQTGRTVRLTKWGREFNKYVSEGLDSIDKGIQISQEHANNLSGTIDIGCIFTVQSEYLPNVLHQYHEKYGSNVEIKLYQGLTQGLIEGLESGIYDIAICAYVDNKPGLCFVPILAQDLVIVVHEDSDLADRDTISFEELRGRGVVTYRATTPIGKEVSDLIGDIDLTINQVCDDEITLGSVISANSELVGISLNTLGLAPFSKLKKLTIKDIESGFHPVYMVYRKNSYKTRATENMIELVTKLADEKAL